MAAVDGAQRLSAEGHVIKVAGLIVEGRGPGMGVGSTCKIESRGRQVLAEVVGFREHSVMLMTYGETSGIAPGAKITLVHDRPYVLVGNEFIGRVVDGMGEPIDDKGPINANISYPLYGVAANPMKRRPIRQAADVGIGAINGLLTLGKGQRIGIMAGSGVGKSVLMGMMARHTSADVTVIAMIGERGREVRDFVEENLGGDGIKKSVVVAATSDTSALIRMRGAYFATTLAEYFRDRGMDVLLVMDSVTRFAMSSRDVGLAVGEPPTVKGYTPSFFAQLPKLLERAGSIDGKGSITGIYTVLVDADDMNDPVGDAVRSITDGHVVLSRDLSNRGHYPPIDVLSSSSRVMRSVVKPDHMALALRAKEVLATYRDAADLISLGAYVDGSDPGIDYAKKIIGDLRAILRQGVDERVTVDKVYGDLKRLLGDKDK